jgi:hypothetical protein
VTEHRSESTDHGDARLTPRFHSTRLDEVTSGPGHRRDAPRQVWRHFTPLPRTEWEGLRREAGFDTLHAWESEDITGGRACGG